MKHKTNSLRRVFYLFGILILTLILVGFGFYYYLFSFPQLTGRNGPSSPAQIAWNFAFGIYYENGEVNLTLTALLEGLYWMSLWQGCYYTD